MSQHRSLRVLLLQGTVFSALALPFATAAMAQDAAKGANEEIVVTGTQIRGISPVGADPVTITPEQITEAPGISTDAVLATIPQLSFFNTQLGINSGLGAPNGGIGGVDTPTIHGLPTLILLDGHRIASSGTNLTAIDPSIIPKGVLSGIEIVPDGGSAIYGSDAIGGVINFTTKKRFNGVDIDGDVGLDSGSQTYRLNATVGKEWNEGSIYLGYAFEKQTPLFGRDRPWITYHNGAPGVVNTGCEPSTVALTTAGVTTYYNPTGIGANGKPTGYTTPAPNCNPYTNETVVAEEHQHSFFAGWSQDITQWLSVDTRAFYTKRDSDAESVTSTQNNPGTTVTNKNFYFTPVGAETTQTIGFSLTNNQPVPSKSDLQEWGISSTVTADLPHDFQARLLGNYSKSNTGNTSQGMDGVLLASALTGTTQATALDPYSPLANPQSALLAHEIMSETGTARGQTDEYQARLVMDGPLFHIPGGDVKIAVGGEVLRDIIHLFSNSVNYQGAPAQGNPQSIGESRTVTSAFGELNVPLVSPDNNVALVHKLDFSAAGRFDHYSDFGNTFNPRFALSYIPDNWITLRGTWGRSFIAPQLYYEFEPRSVSVAAGFPGYTLPAGPVGFAEFGAGDVSINVSGGNPNLKPETSKTYTFGGDVKVPFIDGAKVSLTYYNTQYTSALLSFAGAFNGTGALFTPEYAPFVVANPTQAQALAAVGNLPLTGTHKGTAITSIPQLYALTQPLYILTLGFANNTGLTYVSGLDFNVSYTHPTSFGSLNFSAGGEYNLKNSSNNFPGGPYTNNLMAIPGPVFHGTATVGADIGSNFHATVSLLHTGGYSLLAGESFLGQIHVSSYDVVNTFFSYTLNGDYGMVKGTELRLTINNLLSARPATDTASGNSRGFDGESVVGRLWELGFHKKF